MREFEHLGDALRVDQIGRIDPPTHRRQGYSRRPTVPSEDTRRRKMRRSRMLAEYGDLLKP